MTEQNNEAVQAALLQSAISKIKEGLAILDRQEQILLTAARLDRQHKKLLEGIENDDQTDSESDAKETGGGDPG